MATSTATATPTTTSAPANPLQPDPWTTEQELALLKALVQFKPVGIHAHFRMLSIQQFLLNSGTCTPDDEHTRIPGIWAKLSTLYDLNQLNEREDSVIASPAPEDEGTDREKRYWRDFELPRDDGMGGDFERLMWERRLAPEGTPEEEWSSTGREKRGRRESTVAGTDEPRSSPVAGSGSRGGRGGRRGGRVAKLKGEVEVSEGRGSRRESKTASEAGTKDGDGDENMEDADDDEDRSGEGDDDESESEEPEEDEKRSGPAKRGRGGRRGRGRRGRRRG